MVSDRRHAYPHKLSRFLHPSAASRDQQPRLAQVSAFWRPNLHDLLAHWNEFVHR
jgi:hypothetical protein